MRIWFAVMVMTATWLSTEGQADACTCLPPDMNRSYDNADHVVHARVVLSLGVSGGQRRYLAVTEEAAFKGCLPAQQFVVLQTASQSAACGVTLQVGQSYLLHGQALAPMLGLPRLGIFLCDANVLWSDLSAEHRNYLDTRFVCCGGKCACFNSDEVQCFVDPCQVSRCDVEGAECRSNYCGGCNAEWIDPTGALVCTGDGGAVACRRGGCSGQLCVAPGEPDITTCEWRPEYACYQAATCEAQPDGDCAFTLTPELRECLAQAR